MGAYYQVALSTSKTPTSKNTLFIENQFLKFLDAFYIVNYQTKEIYECIKDAGSLYVATICDYDCGKGLFAKWSNKAVCAKQEAREHDLLSAAEYAKLRVATGFLLVMKPNNILIWAESLMLSFTTQIYCPPRKIPPTFAINIILILFHSVQPNFISTIYPK